MDNKVKLEEIAKKIYPTHKGLTIVASNKTMLRRCAWAKGAEWQSEKMYNEEDVLKLILTACKLGFANDNETIQWFEQFKKK